MKDVRTYTRNNTPSWATDIATAVRAGDLDTARRMFRDAAAKTTVEDAIYATAADVEPAPGEITVGETPLVYGNPFRDGYSWRCGTCLEVFRRGGPDPKSGVNYKTLQGASNAAHRHAQDDHAGKVPVKEITR